MHVRVFEQGFRRGGEIAVARAHTNDQISILGQQVRRQAAGFADPADVQRMAGHHRTFAGLCFGEGNIEALGERLQRGIGARVFDPTTADDQWLALAFEQRQCITEHRFGGRTALDAVHAFFCRK